MIKYPYVHQISVKKLLSTRHLMLSGDTAAVSSHVHGWRQLSTNALVVEDFVVLVSLLRSRVAILPG